jgi:hypothetical protein
MLPGADPTLATVGCWKCVSPWVYPGLKGGPWHPIPSDWPSPNLVVDTVCHVFNTEGVELRIYATNFRRLPLKRIGRDQLFGHDRGVLFDDARSMLVHVIRHYCMWLPSPIGHPETYSFGLLADLFEGRTRDQIYRYNQRALALLPTDQQFARLLASVLEKLKGEGYSLKRRA